MTISRVATIELEGGAVVATTPLAKLGEGDAFWIEASARETLVVGYEDAQLVDPQTGELPESIDTDLLARGDPCGPLLPQPAWVARLDAREAAPIDPALAPALSAPWLTTRCAPPAAIDLDVRCDEPRCISETRRSSACTLEVTSAGCALERITLRYRGSELACLETQGSTWQCVQESSADGRDVFQCGEDLACIVEVHPRDRDEAPPHDVVRLQFGEGGPLIPNTNGQVTMTLPRRLYDYGYGFEVLPLDGRVVITSSPIGGSPAPCPDGQERRLVFVDPDAMIVTGTATAPTCLERLERESGTTFLGGFRENGQPMIGRFDRDGNLLRAISLADGARTAITHVLKIKKSSTGFVVLLSNLMGAGVDGASDLVFLNTDLSIRSRHISAELLYALTIVGPTRAAVWTLGGPGTNNMLIVSGDGDPVEMAAVPVTNGFRANATAFLDGRIFVFADDDKENITYTYPPLFPERAIAPVGIEGYLADADLFEGVIIGGGASGAVGPGYVPELFFVDASEGRFLAGRHAFEGVGPISAVRTGEDGRAWALLPWDGALLRITARRPR